MLKSGRILRETKTLDIGVADATEMVVAMQNQVEGTNIYVDEAQTPSAPSPKGKVRRMSSKEWPSAEERPSEAERIKKKWEVPEEEEAEWGAPPEEEEEEPVEEEER